MSLNFGFRLRRGIRFVWNRSVLVSKLKLTTYDYLSTSTDTEYLRYANGSLIVTDLAKNTTRNFPVSKDIMVTNSFLSFLHALCVMTQVSVVTF